MMLNLFIRRELLYPNAVIMGILFLGGCGLLGWTWKKYHESQRYRQIVTGSTIILVLFLFISMIFCSMPDHDEVEHANAAWEMSQGLVPYTDFFQHHSPMLWIVIAPLFKTSVVQNYPVESIRLLSTCISLSVLIIMGFMAKYLWKENKVIWIVILFFIGNFLTVELYNLRPDLLANLCNMAAFFLILRYRKICIYGLAGILMGFSFSLSPKYLPYILLLPVLLVMNHKNWSFYFRAFATHVFGILIGLLPLFFWLENHGLWEPFYRWVIWFNANRFVNDEVLFGGKFDLILTGFALWGCYHVFKFKDEKSTYAGQLLCIMMVLSAVIYLKPSRYHHEYYEQMYILCAIIAASGPFFIFMKKLFDTHRTAPAFLLVGVILWYGVHSTQNSIRNQFYIHGRETIHILQKIAENEEVVCITPDHPITSRNAIYISTGWQYMAWLSNPACRERLNRVVQDIKMKNPAVIFNRSLYMAKYPGIVEHFQNQKILSKGEADLLQEYLYDHYRLKQIYNCEFWIRKDRYEKYFEFERN